MGLELGAAVAGFTFLGIWIDRRYDTEPWGVLVCAAIGVVGGLYNFVRAARIAAGSSAASATSRNRSESVPGSTSGSKSASAGEEPDPR